MQNFKKRNERMNFRSTTHLLTMEPHAVLFCT